MTKKPRRIPVLDLSQGSKPEHKKRVVKLATCFPRPESPYLV